MFPATIKRNWNKLKWGWRIKERKYIIARANLEFAVIAAPPRSGDGKTCDWSRYYETIKTKLRFKFIGTAYINSKFQIINLRNGFIEGGHRFSEFGKR